MNPPVCDKRRSMMHILGWDIGAANIKAAVLAPEQGKIKPLRVASQPFEIWRRRDSLPEVLRSVYDDFGLDTLPDAMAVTMTAELSDVFATKREGVLFVLKCLDACFPESACYVFGLSGEFVPLEEARKRPLDFAASNWLASAQWISGIYSDCLLVDVGSTTTDIIPIADSRVCTAGRTDTERLSSGELVFTGALRTNLAAIVQYVPIAGRFCRVASEYFAISGDIHLILGCLAPQDYSCTTPDGRPPSVDSSRGRLARLVCADTEALSAEEIDEMARYIHRQQIHQICQGMSQTLSRLPRLRNMPVLVMGMGAFLAEAAAARIGLEIRDLTKDFGKEQLAVMPCIAASHLLADSLKGECR
jgi:probable H4MPT-linked C1 transfer pathway protein